jgi:hypothetical protein
MTILMNPEINNLGPAQGDHKEECRESKFLASNTTRPSGSISQPTARNRLTYD